MPKDNSKKNFIHAVGRRKEAVARVRLYSGSESVFWGEQKLKKGDIILDGKPIEEVFPSAVERALYEEPLKLTKTLGDVILTIKTSGGGRKGQLDAIVLGISRALSMLDKEENRPVLKKRGLLTRDPRVKERRKVGTGGKARRKKQSPKR